MTGFGRRQANIKPFGKVSAELRSINHKFFEAVLHLPEGFIALEERIKGQIEARLKRGRLTCIITVLGGENEGVFINKPLVKNYLAVASALKRRFAIHDELSINTLMHLPGVVSLEGNRASTEKIWPRLKPLLAGALDDLVKMRQKEGRALTALLSRKVEAIRGHLVGIKARFRKAIRERLKRAASEEERAGVLKGTDITEELERLAFHARNFKNKLKRRVPVGKELDFIAQEMQREANTMSAKSFDTGISARMVQVKSLIEKIREQAQNIE
jgi:uncharacterized protein (TIGR00255 family)